MISNRSQSTSHCRLEIETTEPCDREYDSFAIPDIHGDPEAFGNSLEHAKLIERKNNTWAPTSFALQSSTRTTLLGDIFGKGQDVFGVLNRITELRNKGMSIEILAGNHEAVMLQALLHGSESEALRKWARATGYRLISEINRHFSGVDTRPFRTLANQIMNTRGAFYTVMNPAALSVARQHGDVLYLHALPCIKWMKHFAEGGDVAMNTHFQSLLTRDEVHRVARANEDYSAILWKHENTSDQLDPSVTATLQKRGVQLVVRGHDHLQEPRVQAHSNNVHTVTIDTGISNHSLDRASGYAYFYSGRNGETYAVSGS